MKHYFLNIVWIIIICSEWCGSKDLKADILILVSSHEKSQTFSFTLELERKATFRNYLLLWDEDSSSDKEKKYNVAVEAEPTHRKANIFLITAFDIQSENLIFRTNNFCDFLDEERTCDRKGACKSTLFVENVRSRLLLQFYRREQPFLYFPDLHEYSIRITVDKISSTNSTIDSDPATTEVPIIDTTENSEIDTTEVSDLDTTDSVSELDDSSQMYSNEQVLDSNGEFKPVSSIESQKVSLDELPSEKNVDDKIPTACKLYEHPKKFLDEIISKELVTEYENVDWKMKKCLIFNDKYECASTLNDSIKDNFDDVNSQALYTVNIYEGILPQFSTHESDALFVYDKNTQTILNQVEFIDSYINVLNVFMPKFIIEKFIWVNGYFNLIFPNSTNNTSEHFDIQYAIVNDYNLTKLLPVDIWEHLSYPRQSLIGIRKPKIITESLEDSLMKTNEYVQLIFVIMSSNDLLVKIPMSFQIKLVDVISVVFERSTTLLEKLFFLAQVVLELILTLYILIFAFGAITYFAHKEIFYKILSCFSCYENKFFDQILQQPTALSVTTEDEKAQLIEPLDEKNSNSCFDKYKTMWNVSPTDLTEAEQLLSNSLNEEAIYRNKNETELMQTTSVPSHSFEISNTDKVNTLSS